MMKLTRLAIPTVLGVAALSISIILATRNVDAAQGGGEKATKDAVTSRIEAFLANIGDTTKRGEFISKFCEGGPIEGLQPNQLKINSLANTEISRYGVPMPGGDCVSVAEEKNISNFFTARTYVVRCERGPSVWHVLLYNGAKGWGVSEVGIAPDAHCLIPTWRDFTVVPVAAKPQPSNAGGNR